MKLKNIVNNNSYLKWKTRSDAATHSSLMLLTTICASIIIVIVGFILYKGLLPFFTTYKINNELYRVDILVFLSSNTWFISPNVYGIGFIFINTLYIMGFSILLAVPISVLTALFIVRIAPKPLRYALSYMVELLASIPSIIYGVFGVGVITTLVRWVGSFFGYQSAGGISILATIIVLAIMIIPTITLISMTSIQAVKKNIIDGSLALGASEMETNFKVVLSASKNGIFTAIILGTGRALGEATAISMVIGNSGSGPNFNLFDTSRTLTSTILLGIKETSGLDYDIRFSVGIILILLILFTNWILSAIKRRVGGVL